MASLTKMSTSPETSPDGAEAVAWDLEPLVAGEGAKGVERLLDEAEALADSLAERARGKLATVAGEQFVGFVNDSATIGELINRAHAYAALRFSTDTADPERGALMAMVQERATAISTKLLFLELEWTALDGDRAAELSASEGLERARHYLKTLRDARPHLLTESEEKILAEKGVTGRSAWSRLFSELVSSIEVKVAGEDPQPLDSALSRLASNDRAERRAVAEAVTGALEPGLRTRAYLFNTLLADKATDDRLRSYPSWISSRNLANEASDESVQALVAAVRSRYSIPQRWYRLKAQLIGVDRLADYDRAAALVGARLAASRFMDYGGILFVASVAALTGGTFRNLVLDIPLTWIEKPYLLGAVLLAVVLTIVFKWSKEVGSFVLFIDSIGLGVSTVAGTALALDLNLVPIPAILLGLLSAVLGGLTRDLLAQVPPVLLHRETNGTASFIGASALVIAIEVGANQELASAIGFVLVIGIRLLSIKQNWNLPKIKG